MIRYTINISIINIIIIMTEINPDNYTLVANGLNHIYR